MLGSKIKSRKRLASKVKGVNFAGTAVDKDESLLLSGSQDPDGNSTEDSKSPRTPSSGYFQVYIGEERRRFMVKTKNLSHPLFKMLLEKASNVFGYECRKCWRFHAAFRRFKRL